jgi:hypothetical protein
VRHRAAARSGRHLVREQRSAEPAEQRLAVREYVPGAAHPPRRQQAADRRVRTAAANPREVNRREVPKTEAQPLAGQPVAIASRPRAVAREVARLSAALEPARRWAESEALVVQVGAAGVEAAEEEPQPAARDAAVRPREAVRAAVPQSAERRAAVQAGKAELPPAVRGGAPVRRTGVAAQAAEQAVERAARHEVAPRRAAVRDGVAPLPAVARAAVRRRVAPDARAVLYPALVWAVPRAPFLLCPVRQPAARFARGTARLSIASP